MRLKQRIKRGLISRIRGFSTIRKEMRLDAWNRFVRSLTPNASFGRE